MITRNAPHNLKYLDLNFFVTAEKIFDSAEALVKPGSLEALHVQKDRLIVDGALLYLWPWLDRKLAPEERKRVGMLLNAAKQKLEEAFDIRQREFRECVKGGVVCPAS